MTYRTGPANGPGFFDVIDWLYIDFTIVGDANPDLDSSMLLTGSIVRTHFRCVF